jgi:hypothetical protein
MLRLGGLTACVGAPGNLRIPSGTVGEHCQQGSSLAGVVV